LKGKGTKKGLSEGVGLCPNLLGGGGISGGASKEGGPELRITWNEWKGKKQTEDDGCDRLAGLFHGKAWEGTRNVPDTEKTVGVKKNLKGNPP